ncbi:hypothetical protein [Streptosporangium sp. KLBMP 9127]|nr:hypothetical protein [Streptosporangium sp. KLBMP 9127]
MAFVLLAGATAVVWLTAGDPPRAAAFRGERTSAVYAPIATRVLDPEPLTVQEVFAASTVTSGRVTLARQGTEALTDCVEAVWGTAATEAVKGCNQVMRARYGTPDGKVSGQFTVFNLPDAAAADRLVAALEPAGGFVRLAADQPPDFDGTRSRAQARALGHYVTVGWVAPVGGKGNVDLTYHQVALDTVGRAVNQRVVDAG